jgi:hypothetical protein
VHVTCATSQTKAMRYVKKDFVVNNADFRTKMPTRLSLRTFAHVYWTSVSHVEILKKLQCLASDLESVECVVLGVEP